MRNTVANILPHIHPTNPRYWIVALLSLVVLGIDYGLAVSSRAQQQLSSWETERQQLRQQQRDEYRELISLQNQKHSAESTQTKSQSTKGQRTQFSPLIGTQVVQILFVAPANVSLQQVQQLATAAMGSDWDVPTSIGYTKTLIERQAKEFPDVEVDIRLVLHPNIITANELTTVGDMANPWAKDRFGLTKLKDEFETLARNQGIVVRPNDKLIFVLIDQETQNTYESDRFFDSKTFRSFADDSLGRAYVNWSSFSTYGYSYLTEVIIHELLHLYRTIVVLKNLM